MWIKAAVLGGSGIIFPNLAIWTMAVLGIEIAFHSSLKWVNSVVAQEEGNDSEIERLPDEKKDSEIDQLPDDILGDIVSRLSLIEASRTSILSSRWRRFWTTKSEVVFTCFDTEISNGDRQRLIKAADQCLQLYSDHGRKLRVFYLTCCILHGDTCHLVRWMQTLARLDVEELHIGNPCLRCNRAMLGNPVAFSFKLIDGFSKLKHLRLMNCYVEASFVGQCVSLTRIYLEHLKLLSHQLSDILTNVTSSCPNLGYLCMRSCVLPLNVTISGPNLKLDTVEIIGCFNVKNIEISDNNVTRVFIKMSSEVEILLSSLPKMNKLHLKTPGMNFRFGDVTRDLPELQFLMMITPYQVLRLPPTFRAFRNIRTLGLPTSGNPKPEGSEEVDLWNFAPVLDVCPFLENFYLAIGGPVCKEERNAEWPVVQHKHLSFMELSGFSNTQNELEFARFILTSAQVLRSFILQVCPRKFDNSFNFSIDEGGKDSRKIDARVAEAVRADLQGHAHSIHTRVMIL